MGQSLPLFVYFRSFHISIIMTNIQFELVNRKKRRWCVLWTQNLDSRMEGADESTELRRQRPLLPIKGNSALIAYDGS